VEFSAGFVKEGTLPTRGYVIMTVPRPTAVVADDHALLRSGIVQTLTAQSDVQVVSEAADGLTAIAAAKTFRPNLLTLDLALPYAHGISVYS
jgi:DNA-binding NarL/FixJ family response regulator